MGRMIEQRHPGHSSGDVTTPCDSIYTFDMNYRELADSVLTIVTGLKVVSNPRPFNQELSHPVTWSSLQNNTIQCNKDLRTYKESDESCIDLRFPITCAETFKLSYMASLIF